MKTEKDYIVDAKISGLAILKHLTVDKQTEAICFAAVTQNPYALKYAYYQSERVCIAAVSKIPGTINQIRTKVSGATKWMPVGCLSDKVYKAAVIRYPGIMKYIPGLKQTYELCDLALENCHSDEYKLEVLNMMLNTFMVKRLMKKYLLL